jgi:lysophospholipase L1-like esterase
MKKSFIILIVIALLTNVVTVMAGKRVLFIGDSVTDGGWGRSGGLMKPSTERNQKDLNHIYGHSYMMLCAAKLESMYPEAEMEFRNRGISGDDLTRLEARWQEDAVDWQPDILSLLIGTNDVSYYLERHPQESFNVQQWEQRYRRLLDRIREVNPHVGFILGTPFVAAVGKIGSAADYRQRTELIKALDEAVVRIAHDYNAVVLRYDQLFAAQQTLHPSVPMNYWIWDGIHPTAAGHQLMANMWLDGFATIVASL